MSINEEIKIVNNFIVRWNNIIDLHERNWDDPDSISEDDEQDFYYTLKWLQEHRPQLNEKKMEIPSSYPNGKPYSPITHFLTNADSLEQVIVGKLGQYLTKGRNVLRFYHGDLSNQLIGLGKEKDALLKSPLILRLKNSRKESVVKYIVEAERKANSKDFDGGCHEMRSALEEIVVQLSNDVKQKQRKRQFKDAIKILEDSKIITPETALTITTKQVGLFGWLSIKGVHAEATVKGSSAKSLSEARFALNWGKAVITMLLDAYDEYLKK